MSDRSGAMLLHFAAEASPGCEPFSDPAAAWWFWWRLRLAFPAALAACLMPNHLHGITKDETREGVRTRLAHLIAQLTARAGAAHMFRPVPLPKVVPNAEHLARQVRYVHLNPCRAGLVSDPDCWAWSTHRGVVGAELEPWVNAGKLARALLRPIHGFRNWFHQYVSRDSSVEVAGTPLPAACDPQDLPVVPLDVIRRAALSATPWSNPCLRRKLVVELALHQGWRDTDLLARASELSARSVRRIAASTRHTPPPDAALFCLGDRRLLLPDELIYPIQERPRPW